MKTADLNNLSDKENIDNNPLISVIIPVYNRPQELHRAIASILNQTYQNFEILVVDDGSEEDLKKVCDSFEDYRICFHRNETHSNANVARNKGIKIAKGEYISMLDSDDEYLPNHLERRISKIREWRCDGIFGSAYVFDGLKRTLKYSRPKADNETMLDYIFSGGSASTPSHFYKKKAASDTLWDENLFRHQDYDFSIRFGQKFNFMSDYEPTIIINWLHNDKRLHNFDSYIAFIDKWADQIKPHFLVAYCSNMLNLAKEEESIHATNYYKNLLKNNLLYLTPGHWLVLNNANSALKKTHYIFIYFFLIVKQILLPRKIN